MRKKAAISNQRSTISQRKTEPKKSKDGLHRSRNTLRFSEVVGKTVAFVEMDWSAEFPCVEIGFEDKTSVLVLMGHTADDGACLLGLEDWQFEGAAAAVGREDQHLARKAVSIQRLAISQGKTQKST